MKSDPDKKNTASLHAFGQLLRRNLSDSQRFLLLCILSGVCCGLVGVVFQLSINGVFHTLIELGSGQDPLWSGLTLLGMPVLGGAVVGLALQFISPSSAGSGIPQTKAAYYNNFGIIPLRDGLWRLLITTLSIGSGNSLGREGPTVHICAAVSSSIGQWFGLAKARVQAMVPVGMGAGIAAAFNTPIAALFFVFEKLLNDFSSKALGGIVVAVVIAAIVEHSILGNNASLIVNFEGMDTAPWMLVSIPLGIAAAFLGHFFVSHLLWWRQAFRQQKVIPKWARPAIGGLGVGIIGLTVFLLAGSKGVFGTGHADLNASLAGALGWKALLLLFIGKLLATSFCFGSGGSGGIFAPTLFLGSMLGGLFGWAMVGLFPDLPAETIQACALLGVGAFFASVIRCKFTSMLMIIELTQNYTLVLPLMAGNLLAYAIAYRLRPIPVYDALLIQDGVSLKRMPTYRGEQDWRNLPVSTIMTHDTVCVYAGESPADAVNRLREKPHHGYPVLKEKADDRIVLGMVTHHELEEWARDKVDRPIGSLIQERKLVSIPPDASIRDVANTLVLEDVLQAPIVSTRKQNRLLGIVTLHDIARQQNAIEESIGR